MYKFDKLLRRNKETIMMISVKNLCFDYPEKRALHDISFEIEPHSITALVGPNGAGKTTLLRCLAALDSWTLGEITIAGINVEEDPRGLHKICSYLSDFFGMYDELTVEKSLTFIAMSHGAPANQQAEMCVTAAKNLNVMEYFDKTVGSLSRGLRQRVAIAQAIVVPPQLLILDEPASGLDPQARFDLSKMLITLKKQGITIIVSSHILSELEDYSTHMLMIENGKIRKQCALDQHQSTQRVYKLTLNEPIADFQTSLEACGLSIIESQEQTALVTLAEHLDSKTILQTLIKLDIPVEHFSLEKQSMQQVYLSAQKEGDDT